MGMYMNQKGLKKVFQIGPNYAAGRDMLQGMRNTYKGEVIGQELTRWPDQLTSRPSFPRRGRPTRTRSSYSIPVGPEYNSSRERADSHSEPASDKSL